MPAIGQGPAPGAGFLQRAVPGAGGAVLQTLQRAERTAPLRYRVIVIPGSGCAGMGPIADRYFAGLLHAQVLVLHKPGVDPGARTAPADCPHSFVSLDRHSTWLAHARAALRADALLRPGQPALPQLLVGISEGAELLPALAREVPHLAGLVLIGASGLDPQEAGALQARRVGAESDWTALGQLVAGAPHDSVVVPGLLARPVELARGAAAHRRPLAGVAGVGRGRCAGACPGLRTVCATGSSAFTRRVVRAPHGGRRPWPAAACGER